MHSYHFVIQSSVIKDGNKGLSFRVAIASKAKQCRGLIIASTFWLNFLVSKS